MNNKCKENEGNLKCPLKNNLYNEKLNLWSTMYVIYIVQENILGGTLRIRINTKMNTVLN